MNRIGRIVLFCAASVFVGAFSADAQMGAQAPAFKGSWKPVVGKGAVYQMEAGGMAPMIWEVACVGQEAGGYWIEMRTAAPAAAITKILITPIGAERTIIQAAGQPPMEFPAMGAQSAPPADVKQMGEYLGKEPVSTPGGTFTCDHYRLTDPEIGQVDAWVTDDISPYGLVKQTASGMTMTLQRVTSGETTRITGEPQKFQFPQMPQMPGQSEE